MRGHIVKRGKDSYSVVLSLGYDEHGKRIRQWITVQGGKREAQAKLTELLHQKDTGSYVRQGKTTVKDYLERWLRDYAHPSLSPKAYDRYADIVRRVLIPSFGAIPLTQLKPGDIEKLYASQIQRGLNPLTVRCSHAVIHSALTIAVKWGLVSRNVADAVSPPKAPRKEMQVWTENEVVRFLTSAKSTHYFALFYTALYTGARRSELLALTWGDVDFLFGQLRINRGLHQINGQYVYTQPKSAKSRRTIALTPSNLLILTEHRKVQDELALHFGRLVKDTDSVFSNGVEGQPLRPNTVTRAWTIRATRAGVKIIRFHDARHTHASLMLRQGIHPKVVQERLGHSSISITLDTYSHVTPGLQDAAAKRFDEAINATYNENEKAIPEKIG